MVKRLALGGLGLVGLGLVVFLLGAYVWTTDARHGSISIGVTLGLLMMAGGLVALVAAAIAYVARPK